MSTGIDAAPHAVGTTNEAADGDLPFERWTEISARLIQLDVDARLDLLDAEAIEPADWDAADLRWAMAIATDVAAGRMERASTLGLRCSEEMQRRARGEAPPVSASAAALAPSPVVVAVPDVVPAPRAPVVPSYLKAPAPETSAPAVTPPPPAAPPARVSAPAPDVNATAELRSLSSADPLPFDASARSRLPEILASAAQKPRPKPPAASTQDETMAIPALREEPDALPFAAPTSAPREWTPSMYASLCAELAVAPERRQEVLQRYFLADDAARRRVDQEWSARTVKDPRLLSEFQRLYASFRAYLEQQGRAPA